MRLAYAAPPAFPCPESCSSSSWRLLLDILDKARMISAMVLSSATRKAIGTLKAPAYSPNPYRSLPRTWAS